MRKAKRLLQSSPAWSPTPSTKGELEGVETISETKIESIHQVGHDYKTHRDSRRERRWRTRPRRMVEGDQEAGRRQRDDHTKIRVNTYGHGHGACLIQGEATFDTLVFIESPHFLKTRYNNRHDMFHDMFVH